MTSTVGLSTLETVVICQGQPTLVETQQNTGESVTDFRDRHKAAVAAKRAECSVPATVEPSQMTTPFDCNGVQEPIVTEQNPGEPFDKFVVRHQAIVAAAVAACES